MSVARVEVLRGGVVESIHRVHVAVVDGAGRLRARAGNVSLGCFARSAVKPMQALPLVEDGVAERFALTDRELALCCASHSGEPYHVSTVAVLLKRLGLGEESLACGSHAPFHEASARRLREEGVRPGRLHNNCSGKHAGMLALACAHGWPGAGYQESGHPVQRRMLEEMARWTSVPVEEIPLAVDGCGVVTFGFSVESMARAFGRFAAAARTGGNGPAGIVHAMVRNPEYVGGTDRLCTTLMRITTGRLFAKVGAEGVYCAGSPGAELGIALKVEDGARRAAEPALLAVLHRLGLISAEEVAELAMFAEPDVTNTRGEVVGGVRAYVRMEAC